MSQNNTTLMSQADKVVAINWKITQGLNALGLKPSAEDQRLAVEIADLVEAKDIDNITVKLVGDEVSIVFNVADETKLDGELAGFMHAVKQCGYELVGRHLNAGNDAGLSVNLKSVKRASFSPLVSKDPMNTATTPIAEQTPPTAMAAALEAASVGKDPLTLRETLDTVGKNLDDARHALEGVSAASLAGRIRRYGSAPTPEVTPVYPEGADRPTGFREDTQVHMIEVERPADRSQEANDMFTRARARAKDSFAKVDAKMSTPVKVGLGIAGVALLGAGLYFGARHLGFFAKVEEAAAAPEGGVLDAVVAALR